MLMPAPQALLPGGPWRRRHKGPAAPAADLAMPANGQAGVWLGCGPWHGAMHAAIARGSFISGCLGCLGCNGQGHRAGTGRRHTEAALRRANRPRGMMQQIYKIIT